MKITFKNMATVKRIAEACNKPLADKQKKLDKIAALADEIDQLDKSMDLMQQAIAPITGGKKVEDILVRVTSNGVSKWIPNPEKWKWNETEKVWEEIEDAAPAGESAEEAAEREAAAEQARLEAEAQAAEEARQAEIIAAKQRLSASRPATAEPVGDPVPNAEEAAAMAEANQDPFQD